MGVGLLIKTVIIKLQERTGGNPIRRGWKKGGVQPVGSVQRNQTAFGKITDPKERGDSIRQAKSVP